jgi:chromosome segregation ATPase
LESSLTSYQKELNSLKQNKSEEQASTADEVTAMQQRHSELETRCKKLSKLIKKIYQRYVSQESYDPGSKTVSRRSSEDSTDNHHQDNKWPTQSATVSINEEQVDMLSKKCDDDMRSYSDKMSSLLMDISEHGKELSQLRETFHLLKDKFEKEDQHNSSGEDGSKQVRTKKTIKFSRNGAKVPQRVVK